MRRQFPWLLLLLCTGCIVDFEGGAEPEWWEVDGAIVADDNCTPDGGGDAYEVEVERIVTFVSGAEEVQTSCGGGFIQGYTGYTFDVPIDSPEWEQEHAVVVTSTAPFIVWKTESSDHRCPVDEACAVGELVDGEYRAELTVTPKTRYERAVSVIGIATIEDVGEGSATIRVTKIGGYGSGGAGGGPSTSE